MRPLRHARLAAACALALLLGACAVPAPQVAVPAPTPVALVPAEVPTVPVPGPVSPAPIPAPASAPGASTPAEPEPDSAKYQLLDQGLASWYGPGLNGRRTASGERFDRFGFTAAHRTLPFGTRVCVRSLVTGKTVMVRINDRGPFGSDDRVIDLSQGAARELGMIGLGIKPVELWQVDEDGDDCVPGLGGRSPVHAGSSPQDDAVATSPPAAPGTAPLGLKATSLGLKRKSK